MIRSLENPKTDEYINFKNFVLSNQFNWFYWGFNVITDDKNHDNFPFYSHGLITRPTSECLYPKAVSPYSEVAHQVVSQVFDANNIDVSVIYRMNINSVTPTKSNKYSPIHVDHPFPHKNLLIYLTDPAGGETVCGENNYTGKEDDVIIFEGEHYYRPPKEGRRIVLITTFL